MKQIIRLTLILVTLFSGTPLFSMKPKVTIIQLHCGCRFTLKSLQEQYAEAIRNGEKNICCKRHQVSIFNPNNSEKAQALQRRLTSRTQQPQQVTNQKNKPALNQNRPDLSALWCEICTNENVDIKLPCCNRPFHFECLKKSCMSNNPRCPWCNTKINDQVLGSIIDHNE